MIFDELIIETDERFTTLCVEGRKKHNWKRLVAARNKIRSVTSTDSGGLQDCEERYNTGVSGSGSKRVRSGDAEREDDLFLDLFLQQAMKQKNVSREEAYSGKSGIEIEYERPAKDFSCSKALQRDTVAVLDLDEKLSQLEKNTRKQATKERIQMFNILEISTKKLL